MEMSIMFGYLIGKSVRAMHIPKAVPKINQQFNFCKVLIAG